MREKKAKGERGDRRMEKEAEGGEEGEREDRRMEKNGVGER